MEEINFEEFFKKEFDEKYRVDIPCEWIEGGCGDNEEGTPVRGFDMKYRIMIYIINSEEIALFVEEPDENPLFVEEPYESHLPLSMGKDVFKGMTRDVIRSAIRGLYPHDVVIFSEGKEILASSDVNIGEVISVVIKEQERLLSKELERMYFEQNLERIRKLKDKERSERETDH